jgi:uncharacterized protein (TIGR02265 family)
VFDDSAIDSLYLKGHKRHLTTQLKAELRAVGIDLDQPLKPTYADEVIHAGTRILRRTVYGHHADDAAAYRAMGEATIDGFFDTLIGKAMASVFRLIGFKKIVDRLPKTLARGNTNQQAWLTWQGADAALLEVKDTVPHAAINIGVLERAFRHHFGVAGFKCELVEQKAPSGAVYRLSWPST